MGFRIKDKIFYQEKDPKEVIVQKITEQIKLLHNYDSAYELMAKNAISLEDIIRRTGRLKTEELVRLADLYISR